MFYGYESESQMRECNPKIADHLISIAEMRPRVVCTRGKKCTGSIDGKEFMYDDGSRDFGTTITDCRAKMGGDNFRWSLENDQVDLTGDAGGPNSKKDVVAG